MQDMVRNVSDNLSFTSIHNGMASHGSAGESPLFATFFLV